MSDEMFKSVFIPGSNIKSSWKSERSMNDTESQTGAIDTTEAEGQAIERNSVETQTPDPAEHELKLGTYDEKSLAAFLKRVAPPLLKELDKNLRSHAFEGYDIAGEDSTELLTKLYTLNYSPYTQNFACNGVSWNSVATVVAVAYGVRDHEDWCDHHGGICMWSLNRKDFSPIEPNKKFEYSCCITCIKFHPQQPALLAAGNFIGEILILDLSRDDDLLVSSTETGAAGHHDTVTEVAWVDVGYNKYQIASCGLDGKILIWEQSVQNTKMKLLSAFILLAENLPRSLHIKSSRLRAEVGVNSISFNMEDKSLFLIGSEGGGVFQCSTTSQYPSHSDTVFATDLKNPVTLTYNPHKGHVICVSSSPFSRNIFLSCGSDNEIRIYNLNQATKPLQTLNSENPLAKIDWSPVKALLIAGITSSGTLNLYDLRSAAGGPILSEKLSDNGSAGCVLEFSPKNSNFLATGTVDGSVQIWSLAEKLVTTSSQEIEYLKKMGKTL